MKKVSISLKLPDFCPDDYLNISIEVEEIKESKRDTVDECKKEEKNLPWFEKWKEDRRDEILKTLITNLKMTVCEEAQTKSKALEETIKNLNDREVEEMLKLIQGSKFSLLFTKNMNKKTWED